MSNDTQGAVATPQTRTTEILPPAPTVRPAVDVLETGEAITLLVDLPGVAEGRVELTLEKDRLDLKATRDAASHPGRLSYVDQPAGDYQRQFLVPDAIDRDAISATLRDGVMAITLPKAAQARTRQIEISGR